MKHTIIALSATLALVGGLSAQERGSSNDDAPTITQSIASDEGVELLVEYIAITWSDGSTMAALNSKERGKRARARLNRSAKNSPLGQLRTDQHLSVDQQQVVPGLYSLYFTISEEDLHWRLHAQNEEHDDLHHEWKLVMTEAEKALPRMRMVLSAGESPDDATIEVGFGPMRAELAVRKGIEPTKDETAEATPEVEEKPEAADRQRRRHDGDQKSG